MFIRKNLGGFLRFMGTAAAMGNCLFHFVSPFNSNSSLQILIVQLGFALGPRPPIFPCQALIDTVGIAAHWVTARRESPRPAAAADRCEFANSTLSFERRVIPQLHKNLRPSVNVC